MRRIWIIALVFALVGAMAASMAGGILGGPASAASPGLKGLTQRIEMTKVVLGANTTVEVDATCEPSELLTGGGYEVASIGSQDKVYLNGPKDQSTWVVEVANNSSYQIHDVVAYAVCLSRGN
jgi:hypothetical protein